MARAKSSESGATDSFGHCCKKKCKDGPYHYTVLAGGEFVSSVGAWGGAGRFPDASTRAFRISLQDVNLIYILFRSHNNCSSGHWQAQ